MATPSRNSMKNNAPSSSRASMEYRPPIFKNNRVVSPHSATPKLTKLQQRRINRGNYSNNQSASKNYDDFVNSRKCDDEVYGDMAPYNHEVVTDEYDDEMASEHEDDDMSASRQTPELEVGSSVRKSGFSSERNQWNAVRLMENSCYDSSTGNLLSKELCERNLSNALKSKKQIDFYDMLKFSRSPETLAVSFALYQLNKMTHNGMRSRKDDMATPTKHFEVEAARDVDTVTFLPGGKRVRLSMLILPSMCSNWTGPLAVTKAILTIATQIEHRDKFMMIYSAPDSERSTTYPSLSTEFFDSFAALLQAGFRFPQGSESTIALAAAVRKTLRNHIDKLRREAGPAKLDKLLDEFMQYFNKNSSFRSSEQAIEDVENKDYAEIWTPRQNIPKRKRMANQNDVNIKFEQSSKSPGKETSKKKSNSEPAPAPKRIKRRIN